MKSNCTLKSERTADFTLEVKNNICCCCIDDDGIDCTEGTSIMRAYKEEQEHKQELKEKLVNVILIQQTELAHPERITKNALEEALVEETNKLILALSGMEATVKALNNRTENFERRLNQLSKDSN